MNLFSYNMYIAYDRNDIIVNHQWWWCHEIKRQLIKDMHHSPYICICTYWTLVSIYSIRKKRRRIKQNVKHATLEHISRIVHFFYSMYVYAIISCFIRFLAYWLDRLRITEPFSPVVFSPNKMINCLSFFHFSFRSFNHCCRLLICSKAEMWKEKGKKCERIKLHHTSFFTTHSLIVVMM